MDAKSQMLKSRSIKEKFEKAQHEHHNRPLDTQFSWEKHTYPDYKSKKAKLTKPDFVEFGKAFDISITMIATDSNAVKAAYQMALDDFFRAKAENFPSWEGIPEIKVNSAVDSLRRIQQIGWYAQVPKKHVLTEEDKLQKLDEELWNS